MACFILSTSQNVALVVMQELYARELLQENYLFSKNIVRSDMFFNYTRW